MTNNDLELSNYDYAIPNNLIAQTPTANRQDSKLFVVDRTTEKFFHKKFSSIVEYFKNGDCIILNETKVVPSRIFGKKVSGGKVELLFLDPCQNRKEYNVLIKPFIGIGKKVYFENGYECELLSKGENGKTLVKFNKPGILAFLQEYGIMPLPPYIDRKNGLAITMSDIDRKRYQTVYAKNLGAIAAPTAGLHFTDEILNSLKNRGVSVAKLTLHVGWGTFKPIKANNLNEHSMLPEKFVLNKENAKIINDSIKNNKKVVAVGTTSTRAIESIANFASFREDRKIFIKDFSGETSIFIYPGYTFKVINTLITNLHLPKSTPLVMASTFSSRTLVLKAYNEAINKKYRFFSYGDSMLIL
ncbi:MAG: tRNA preQ1(34) S-adenosylmethionine ribosyltransferase-isomerase QueA [Endomicrobium sp.]|jgi:S-adenosylmethionine:tRNA ribosyltransferase-isomerase|nr:tRNA preQ1(34) S-adenosylmethionine ribosyltransferase-isomerase QueA [Endomicrobium sp.]